MVKADIGDYACEGLDDIGAIQTPTESDFNNCNIDFFLSKVVESHGNANFKKGGLDFFDGLFVVFDKFNDFFFSNFLIVYTDSFTKIFVMGACV